MPSNLTDAPLVSVVICTYNGDKYLSQTLQSVYEQTFDDFEIIIVDDGSTDRTKEILEHEKNNKKIRIFYQKNKGLAAARNYAIFKSSGAWIAIIDQDDLCYTDRLEKLVNLAKMNPDVDFFFSNTDYINDNGEIIDDHLSRFKIPYPRLEKIQAANLLLKRGCFIDSESVFAKKSLLVKIDLLNESYRYVCDYDLFIKAGFHSDFFYTAEKLSAWRIHDTQATKKYNAINEETATLYVSYLADSRLTISTKMILVLKIIKLKIKRCIKPLISST